MAGQHLRAQARRVVAGLDKNGKSTIVVDELTTTRAVTDAFTICQIWQVDSLPPPVLAGNSLGKFAKRISPS